MRIELGQRLSRRALIRRGLGVAAGVIGGVFTHGAVHGQANEGCTPTQSPVPLRYGEAVCIAPGETVILKADSQPDLQASITNQGNIDNDPYTEVEAEFMGTSPTPEPSHVSFGGIKWDQEPNGNVDVMYWTHELAPSNPQTWNFVEVQPSSP